MSAPQRSLLSRPQILRHKHEGNIVIDPFFAELLNTTKGLNTSSYDVRLGPWFYREQRAAVGESRVFNPLSEDDVRRYWGEAQRAVSAREWMGRHGRLFKGISPDDYLVILGPGETILAHTIEFIGGRNVVTTEMRAKSSMGRIGVTVCKCAGWGDVGYINRWTMEMTNHLQDSAIPLPVGLRVAQIAFYEVDPVEGSYASEGGNYQSTDDIEEMKRSWSPESMLPKMFRDPDIGRFHEFIPKEFLATDPDGTTPS